MGSSKFRSTRMMWSEICKSDQYSGRWIALDNVRFDPSTLQPVEADVVDVDDDIADLCSRMRAADRTSCAIMHCHEDFVPETRRSVSIASGDTRLAVPAASR
jgi:hypothetical protein